MVIHIRQSKYKKDRIVPLSPTMAIGLEKYLRAENPHVWLFNGKEPDGRYSVKGLSWVMRKNLKKTSISKSVNLHSLRHSGVYSARRNNAIVPSAREPNRLFGHPHLHCIVPAAGYSLSGKWRHIGKYDNYLYPVFSLFGNIVKTTIAFRSNMTKHKCRSTN